MLALPFMPSILPRDALAQSGAPPRKRFVALATDHGAVWGRSMYPNPLPMTQSASIGGFNVSSGPLQLNVDNGVASLSEVLSAPSNVLTSSLANKINVIRGIGQPFYIGHHTGGHLGNNARNDANGGDGAYFRDHPRPTIDQVMAWSSSFYPDLSSVRERAMILSDRPGDRVNISHYYADPMNKSGDIQRIPGVRSALEMFNRIFVPPEDPANQRTPVVDRVYENYRRLRNTDRRLSADDRRRLDEHMQRLSELQRRLNATGSCDTVMPLSRDNEPIIRTDGFGINPTLQSEFWKLHNDVIAAAFACGTSSIAVMQCRNTFSDFDGDWHQNVAHQAKDDAVAQRHIREAHQLFFQEVFVDLIAKLDIDEGNGSTILDNTLVMWTQESGESTHNADTIPIITAGSAADYFNTGLYADYRDFAKPFGDPTMTEAKRYAGLVYNQWLHNVLQSMDVPLSEYAEPDNHNSYGKLWVGEGFWGFQGDRDIGPYPDAVLRTAGDPLPFLIRS